MILTLLLTIFFVLYGFTQPKKEHILNRRDGLITMNGFFWQKNITMRFEKQNLPIVHPMKYIMLKLGTLNG